MRVLLTGCIARMPFGGNIWHHLQFVLGLKKLGAEVWFVELGSDFSDFYYVDPAMDRNDPSFGVETLRATMERYGMADRWSCRAMGRWHGIPPETLGSLVPTFDAYLNLNDSGRLPRLPDELMEVPVRILVDTDPGYLQVNAAKAEKEKLEGFRRHTHFATFAENIGAPDCLLPGSDLPWIKTRQPVDLEEWPNVGPSSNGAFASVMMLGQQKNPLEWNGVRYGNKATELARFAALPSMVHERLHLCLPTREMPFARGLVGENDWEMVPSEGDAASLDGYRRFIQSARGEIAITKQIYVAMRTGWFSERSACFLASGKPVVAQDTGFGAALPSGEGLFAVSSPEEAADAMREIDADYPRHAKAAREVAESHFESAAVMRRLAAACGL